MGSFMNGVVNRRFGFALLLTVGCAEPFSVERHVLGPPRLAAMGIQDGVARAAVWSGAGPWHEESPSLEWAIDGEPLGTGFDVHVPIGRTLEVTVRIEGEEDLVGSVSVGAWPGIEVVRQVVERPSDLSLSGRLDATRPEPVSGGASADQLVRLTANRLDDSTGEYRWMISNAAWSILELEPASADVVAADVQYEDGELIDVVDGPSGVATVLALSVDGRGNNAWKWMDVAFDVTETLLPIQGRLFAVSPDTATDTVLTAISTGLPHVIATLAATSNGLELVDVVEGGDLGDDLTAFPAPDCAPERSFDLWTIAEGRCALSEVDGARVVLERD